LLWQWQAARKRQRALEGRDPLTGLLNSRAFFERVNAALRRKPAELGIAFLDCDDFKTVNDEFGHLRGNELLLALGKCLREQARDGAAARMGGDEFAVLLECGPAQIMETIERVRKTLAADTQRWSRQVTFSAGIAAATAGTDAESLVRAADDAMYCAKRHGKNRTEMHAPEEITELPTETSAR
jgi:diguanylate cyclase (GGDEF)-like protein